MAAEIPSDLPATLAAGDTWQFTKAFADYPASEGWALSVYVKGVGSVTLTGTPYPDADSAGWLCEKAATDTASVAAGLYTVAFRVSKDGDVFTPETRTVRVTANVATAAAGALQSFAEQQLAVWQARYAALDGIKRYGQGPRQIEGHSEAEIRASLAHWSRVVAKERRGGQHKQRRVTFGSFGGV